MKNLTIITLLCAALFAGNVWAEEETPKKELKILTIGNSFSQSLYACFPKAVESTGKCTVVLEDLNIGGCSLERHWSNIAKEEAEPGYHFFPKYTYREKLQSRAWDVVTIQQVSNSSWQPDTFEPYAENIVAFVRKYAPAAKIYIQQTWAYRPDDGRLAGWKITQREMYEKLTAAYGGLAEKLNLEIIPVGDAVQTARETQPGGYHPFQRSEFTYPDLPKMDGFLCGNILWNDEHTALKGDAFHLNLRGQYLQACVWYAKLYGMPAAEITYVPDGITPEDAAFLRETAQKAVK